MITFVCLSLTFFLFVCLIVFILLVLRNEPSDVCTLGKHPITEPHTQATFIFIVQAITYHLAEDSALTSFHSRINCVDLIHVFKFPAATLLSHPIFCILLV